MNLTKFTSLISLLSCIATLIAFVDTYFLGSALSKQGNIPTQVPTYFYLFTVAMLCLVMLALSNRQLKLPYEDYTEKAEILQKQLDGYANTDLEIESLKAQLLTLQASPSADNVLEDRIRAVLMAGSETESGLIRKLQMDTSDQHNLSRVQSMLGKMEKGKSIEAVYGRYQLVKSF